MFDFRYHALSLVAVFLALAVGLLLGVAIGDAGLVSSAKRDIEGNLRSEVRNARGDARKLESTLSQRDDFARQIYPDLVADRLAGRRVGLVFLGGASDRDVEFVRAALENTGAQLRNVATLREPPDLQRLASRAGATRYTALDDDPSLLGDYARRIGRQYAQGGALIRAQRSALMRSFSGDLDGLDAIVVARSDAAVAIKGSEGDHARTLEDGFVRGVLAADRPVVGIERTDSDPSQIGWYEGRTLASVDSVDLVSGRTALVFALAGAAGAFGVKSTADALLPRVISGVSRP